VACFAYLFSNDIIDGAWENVEGIFPSKCGSAKFALFVDEGNRGFLSLVFCKVDVVTADLRPSVVKRCVLPMLAKIAEIVGLRYLSSIVLGSAS